MNEKLVQLIHDHGHEATALATGKLLVASWVLCPDGTWRKINETIPARLGAVRDWLGY
jgi:hypothetical protein